MSAWDRGWSLPGQCLVCRGWQSEALCTACVQRHASPQARCVRCAIDVPTGVDVCGRCVLEAPPQVRTIAAVAYGYPWDRLITGVKLHDHAAWAAPLAALLAAAVRREAAAPRAAMTWPDVVVPMPMTDARLRTRGVHHTWALARHVARVLRLPARVDAVQRLREAPPQVGLDRAARLANVRGAFTTAPGDHVPWRGQNVAVVDDVMTTGATAAELSRMLLEQGAASVQVWVVARTPAAPC